MTEDERLILYRNNFRIFNQIISYCKSNENYNVGIFISDWKKFKSPNALIMDSIRYNEVEYEVKRIRNLYQCSFEFLKNKSLIDILLANSNIRDKRFNFLIIENCILKEIKEDIIYPILISGNNPVNYLEVLY